MNHWDWMRTFKEKQRSVHFMKPIIALFIMPILETKKHVNYLFKKTCELWNDDDMWLWHSTSLISQLTWIYHITCASNKEKWHQQEISRIYPPSLRYSSSWVFVKDMSETALRISWTLFCQAQLKSSVLPKYGDKCQYNLQFVGTIVGLNDS